MMAEEPDIVKCCRRGCITPCQSMCASPYCHKGICTNCFQEKVLKPHGLPALPCRNDIPLVACTKRCYQYAMKDISSEELFRLFYTSQPIMSERACDVSSVTNDLDKNNDENEQDTDNVDMLPPLRDIVFANTLDAIQDQEDTSYRSSSYERNVETLERNEGSVGSAAASRVSKASDQRKRPAATLARVQQESTDNEIATLNAILQIQQQIRHDREMDNIARRQHERELARGLLEEKIRHNREMENIARQQLERQLRDETIRHEREMERIARKKPRFCVYDNILTNMDLVMSSLKVYKQVKDTMSVEQIAEELPNCIKFFNFRSMTELERKKFAKQYNDWAIANAPPGADLIDPDKFN